jgi:serine/threonine-protein kinase
MIADSEQQPGEDGLTDSQLWRIDQVCDGFEAAWKSAAPADRSVSRRHDRPGTSGSTPRNCALDVHYRRQLGESPGITDYQHRFPELAETCLDAELTPDSGDDLARRGNGGHRLEGSRADPDSRLTPGEDGQARKIGKFQLLERVGVGGFGTVWRALDVKLNRTVALKIPHAHLVETAEDIARFYAEARAAAQLRHPGIVTVHEVPELDGLPILICDFVTGTSLRDLLGTGRLGCQAAAQLVAKVADGWLTPTPWEPFIATSNRPTSWSHRRCGVGGGP